MRLRRSVLCDVFKRQRFEFSFVEMALKPVRSGCVEKNRFCHNYSEGKKESLPYFPVSVGKIITGPRWRLFGDQKQALPLPHSGCDNDDPAPAFFSFRFDGEERRNVRLHPIP